MFFVLVREQALDDVSPDQLRMVFQLHSAVPNPVLSTTGTLLL
jgi:hypothetical protein